MLKHQTQHDYFSISSSRKRRSRKKLSTRKKKSSKKRGSSFTKRSTHKKRSNGRKRSTRKKRSSSRKRSRKKRSIIRRRSRSLPIIHTSLKKSTPSSRYIVNTLFNYPITGSKTTKKKWNNYWIQQVTQCTLSNTQRTSKGETYNMRLGWPPNHKVGKCHHVNYITRSSKGGLPIEIICNNVKMVLKEIIAKPYVSTFQFSPSIPVVNLTHPLQQIVNTLLVPIIYALIIKVDTLVIVIINHMIITINNN